MKYGKADILRRTNASVFRRPGFIIAGRQSLFGRNSSSDKRVQMVPSEKPESDRRAQESGEAESGRNEEPNQLVGERLRQESRADGMAHREGACRQTHDKRHAHSELL